MSNRFPILVVDDDPAIAEILTRVAASTFPEADFIAIETFREAVIYLEQLSGTGPRLMLIDIDLKAEQTGFNLLKLIRAHPQGRLLPVIILSADASEQAANEAYRLGANVYTLKPGSLRGWKNYVSGLRSYWFNTATIPRLWFE